MRRIAFALLMFASLPTWASSSDTMNFRVSPLGLIVGAVDVTVDFKVAPDWTLGPTFSYWHFSLDSSGDFNSKFDVTALGGGLRANWFYNGVFTDGLYVGPTLQYASVKVTTSDSAGDSLTGTVSTLLAGALVGYGWFWDNFNMMLGGGLTVGLGDTSVKVTDTNGTSTSVSSNIAGLALEWSMGWTF